MKFVISYSGGKDSALSLYRMISDGHVPVALLTTVDIKQSRSWFHGLQPELLNAVSCSLRIPIIMSKCNPDDYLQTLEKCLDEARQMGADSCVFGDIDIEGHRQWNEELCKSVGLDCVLPLWQQSREELVYEMISAGFKAKIKVIQSDKLDESFLGQDLTVSLIEKINSMGVDVCGENGEYHTFVYDGPVFSYPISLETREIVDFGTHKAINIMKSDR